jgi:hypothetical protein
MMAEYDGRIEGASTDGKERIAQAFYKTQQFAIQSPEEAPKYPDEFSAKNDEVWWGLWDTGKACVDCANFWKLYLHRLSEKEASTLVR